MKIKYIDILRGKEYFNILGEKIKNNNFILL